ncbi:MAG TPA: SRPBCC family protein [Dehalococcoidia bacterium]|nr:SRPBCC family protein [Dehalococcoidia bacterium]
MARVEVIRHIRAPREAVWDVIADLERQAEWMVDVRALRITSAEKRGRGAVLEVTSTLFGLPVLHDVMEVTAWEPPRRVDVLHRGQFHGTGSFLLEPAEGGTTLFVWIEDVQPPLGRLGEALFARLVRPHLERLFGRSLDNVRRLAEARAAGG